jgi:hypothetical protein
MTPYPRTVPGTSPHFSFTVGRGWVSRPIQRALQVPIVLASFVPGLLLVVGPLLAGHDQTVSLSGVLFIAVMALIWWGTFRAADEVTVAGAQITWLGVRCAGSAPLKSLQAVKPSTFLGGAVLTFVIDGKSRFEIPPARGIDAFLDALQKAQPGVDIQFPSRLRWFGRLQHGAFVEYEG